MDEKMKMKSEEGDKKANQVLRSLKRSRVRTEIVMYLYKIYPEASYPAEISRNAGIDATNVLGGLQGVGGFDKANSLLEMELVDKIERDGETYYQLSERGKSFIESIEPPITSYHENDKKKTGGKKQK